MYIVKPIHSKYAFHDEFKAYGRGEQFSIEAFDALFEHLTEFADAQSERYELDVIGECCEWTEYDSMREAIDAYGDDITCLDDLRDRTAAVIVLPSGGVLMTNF